MCFCNVINTKERVKGKNLQIDASNAPMRNDIAIFRNLKGNVKTAAVQDDMEEERGFVDKLDSLLTKVVKNFQKDPKIPTSLKKPSVSERGIKNVKAYFGKLKASQTPLERGFLYATFLIVIVGMVLMMTL
ncbi:hypothetical protein KXD40_002137 [Peronospora effusa]|uniref:Uncharacterized protein n=1 Tax=Peronospora effusa TaxID=542832 RepID=A0A3M6VCZ8_9STRA|nr:hypothetical protein DD238_005681 [Peronospora effusa]RQM13255.1 hypothetical protein DD237_006325 [Peronospora effusa]UIZ26983.1 hypothetical protein KXD40_002137 [Peronospora effusa]CAI5725407.1 unnamed protein product [Peronospora effusa]